MRFFQSIETLNRATRTSRAGIIVVSDSGNPNEVIEAIKHLSESPETQGIRFILTVTAGGNSNVRDVAAACSFREILPLDLDQQSWVNRFNYATARQNITTNQPVPQVTMNNIAGVSIPARISWLTRQHIQFECRIQTKPETQINLAGPIAAALGLRSITTTVISQSKTNLRFRFSDSLLASWSAPASHQSKVDALLEQLKTTSPGPRWRIFVAVQDAELRADALHRLMDLRFDVRVPLQRQHIIDEPKFLGPDLVIIEDNLCIGENRDLFMKMMEQIDRNVQVIIVGRGLSGGSQIARKDSSGIVVLPRIPENFSEMLIRDFLSSRPTQRPAAESNAVYVAPDHQLSFAEVKLPARLTRLHPTMVQIALPVQVGKFGLIKFEAPSLKKILGYYPYGKVVESFPLTNVNHQDQFNYSCEAIFSDVDLRGRRLIGYSLAKAVAERLIGGTAVKKLIPEDALSEGAGATDEILGNGRRGQTASAPNPTPPPPPLSIVPIISRQRQVLAVEQQVGNLALKPVSTQPERIEARQEEVEEYRPRRATQRRSAMADLELFMQAAIDLVSSKTLRYLIFFVVFSVGSFAGVWSLYKVLSSYYQHSGKQYTESIQKMLEQNSPRSTPESPND